MEKNKWRFIFSSSIIKVHDTELQFIFLITAHMEGSRIKLFSYLYRTVSILFFILVRVLMNSKQR